jgi:hypothetical protein
MMGLNGSELKIFTIICFATTSIIYIINGVLCLRREDSTGSSTQIGLGIMFFLIGIAQSLTSD